MKKTLALALLLFTSFTHAEILFSKSDESRTLKEQVLNELITIMGPNGAATYVANHEKVVLWTNEAPILKDHSDGTFKKTTLPSFTMANDLNKTHLQNIILEQTGETISLDLIGGILIANPNQGAVMYYRNGYLGKGPNEEDGRVSPIVIIYHEFAHAKDSLQSPTLFTDLATRFNKRYKNDAEESAVHQQNDLIITLRSLGIVVGDFRQSYGRNDLVLVEDPYSIP